METRHSDNDEVYRFDGFTVLTKERLVKKDGTVLHLRPQVFDLVLSKNSIRVLAGVRIDARDTLADANRFRSIFVSRPFRCGVG